MAVANLHDYYCKCLGRVREHPQRRHVCVTCWGKIPRTQREIEIAVEVTNDG